MTKRAVCSFGRCRRAIVWSSRLGRWLHVRPSRVDLHAPLRPR